MRIYIKTPLFQNSQAVPHLVEHCIGHTIVQLADFFDYVYGVEKMHYTAYTTFDYDNRIDYKDAIAKLAVPLNKASFRYEKNIVQGEITDACYEQRMYEHLVQYLVDANISLNTAKSLFRKDIVSYHQKRYQPNYMVVVNDDYTILYQGYQIQTYKKQRPNFFSFPFAFEKDQYVIVGAKNCKAHFQAKCTKHPSK